uniref:Uncharacterized protein n=1 Tax=viral metagenome TaxID=1070528 RepID=A0A6C0CLU7_9ZZZZ
MNPQVIKIYFAGKMSAGKTFYADKLGKLLGMSIYTTVKKLSFSTPVKEIATKYFGMTKKDRTLLQSIATKLREIDDRCFVNYMVESTNQFEKAKQVNWDVTQNIIYIVDDVRFKIEKDMLDYYGFKGIYLDVDEELQLERQRKLNPALTDQEIKQNMAHHSENSLSAKDFPESNVIKINSDDSVTCKTILSIL